MVWSDKFDGKTIGATLEEAVSRWGNSEKMIFPDARLTLVQLKREVDLAAKGFLKLGVRRGDRVGIWMAGHKEWAYAYYALAQIGAIIVPVNVRYRVSEIEHILKKTGVSVLILKDEQAGNKSYIETLREFCPEIEAAIPGRITSQRFPALHTVIAVAEREMPGVLSYEAFIQAGQTVSDSELISASSTVTPEDPFLIQFTSGTTGLPKGAVLFHLGMLRGCYYGSLGHIISETDRLFSPLPFFHSGGSVLVMLLPIIRGCTVVIQPYFDAGDALRVMERERCDVTVGHQPHWVDYINHPELSQRRLELERVMVFAPPEILSEVAKVMKIPYVMSPYGISETHLAATGFFDLKDPEEKRMCSIGRPVPGMEVVIRDPETGKLLERREEGEICLRGWGVMRGYYADEESTRKVIDAEGWFHSGDLGQFDSDGYLHITGRVKEVIRVGGLNVAANEIERCLLTHPQVKQAVVVAVGDERLGEIPVAWVETKTGTSLPEEHFIKHCQKHLASYKVPRRVLFRNDWPMSGTGKIQRLLLKAEAELCFRRQK